MVGDNPAMLELEVMYASDSEGNGFKLVDFEPSICYRRKDEDGEYFSDSLYDSDDIDEDEELHIEDFVQVVVIN